MAVVMAKKTFFFFGLSANVKNSTFLNILPGSIIYLVACSRTNFRSSSATKIATVDDATVLLPGRHENVLFNI